MTIAPASAAASGSLGDLGGDGQEFVERERIASEARLERLAFDVFHGEVMRAAGFADFVDVRGVGVAERGSGASFLEEAGSARVRSPR